MQQFTIARQYMSKNHNFSHVMMVHFYFGYFLSWFAVMLLNSVWTKNNKDMA